MEAVGDEEARRLLGDLREELTELRSSAASGAATSEQLLAAAQETTEAAAAVRETQSAVERLQAETHYAPLVAYGGSLFDRNEAASWAAAALATEGDIFVGGARQAEMLTFLNVFRKVGGKFESETWT